ncbi:MAG: hypothetical protein J5524_10895 [Bacteroidaceae bacterium]|nr:hypothetical protein [Bacteroidaceae bacterium]
MLQLLDILRRIPDTTRVIPKKVLPDSIPQDTAKAVSTVDVSGDMQQAADISPLPDGIVEQIGSNMPLTFLVVLLGLFLCFLFVKRYRSRQQ